MKKKFSLYLIFALILSFSCDNGFARKMVPNKGAWLDLNSNGILFGTTAAVTRDLGRSKPSVTYYIRRKNGDGKPDKLVPKNGLFSYSLEPGIYEIYDWSMSGSKGHESQDRYEFEVRAGFLTHIGRIVTDVALVENEEGKSVLKNQPFVSDNVSYDAALFTEFYPDCIKGQANYNVRETFKKTFITQSRQS
jgi:hypothetical protein